MIKDIKDIDYGTLFKMKEFKRTFLVVRKYYSDYERLFVDLNTGFAFNCDDLICFGYFFYHKEDDEDFRGVEVIGNIGERQI